MPVRESRAPAARLESGALHGRPGAGGRRAAGSRRAAQHPWAYHEWAGLRKAAAERISPHPSLESTGARSLPRIVFIYEELARGPGRRGEIMPQPGKAKTSQESRSPTVEVWSLPGMLAEFERIHTDMPERRFAWILGAGASSSSGIRTGRQLVDLWLSEIRRQKEDELTGELRSWATAENLDIARFSYPERASYYQQVFARRFRQDRGVGNAYLEKEMARADPSVGYAILAKIMARTRHRVVITTNFDNLVADSVAKYTATTALVCGHESLAGFLVPTPRRPLVGKLHRDLYLDPLNTAEETSGLREGWRNALDSLFAAYTPIVIGYGGNDGSLMGYLEDLVDKRPFPGRLIWCSRKPEDLGTRIATLVARMNGLVVRIEGFDELMLLLAQRLHDEHLPEGALVSLSQVRQETQEWLTEVEKNWTEFLSGLAPGHPAEPVLREMLALSFRSDEETLRNDPGDLSALVRIGISSLIQKKYERALEVFRDVLEKNRALKAKVSEAKTLTNIARSYAGLEDWGHALENAERAIELLKESDDTEALMFATESYALALENLGRVEEAIKAYRDAERLARSIGRTRSVVFSASRAGRLAGDSSQKEELLVRAVEAAESIGEWKPVSLALRSLASFYLESGATKEARDLYFRQISGAEEEGDTRGIAIAHDNLGVVCALEGRYQEAEQSFRRSLWIDEELGSGLGQGKSLVNLGTIAAVQGKAADASRFWRKGQELLEISERDGLTAPEKAAAQKSLRALERARKVKKGESLEREVLL